MGNNDDVLRSRSKEQIIKEAEPNLTIEKVTKLTKKELEQKTASDILIFVQNLDDFEEADLFTSCTLK